MRSTRRSLLVAVLAVPRIASLTSGIQRRNDHDLFADAQVELPARRVTTRLVETLAGLRVSGSSYYTGNLGLVSDLRDAIASYPHEEATYLAGLLDGMAVWADVVRTVSATS